MRKHLIAILIVILFSSIIILATIILGKLHFIHKWLGFIFIGFLFISSLGSFVMSIYFLTRMSKAKYKFDRLVKDVYKALFKGEYVYKRFTLVDNEIDDLRRWTESYENYLSQKKKGIEGDDIF